MFKITIFCALFVSSYAFNVRIVNGTDALPGEFPYAVSLRRNQISHTCGATILNANFVLTAAHCVCDDSTPLDASLFTIQYGSVNISADYTRSIQVKTIYCNDFDYDSLTFDSAVLELNSSIPAGDDWAPVQLAREFDTSVANQGVIIGWGRLYAGGPIPTTLQKLNVDIYTDSLCGFLFNSVHHICFGAPVGGACNGDSGTALISNGLQVGIASFITATCGTATTNYPNVYSRVSAYYDWIANIAGLE